MFALRALSIFRQSAIGASRTTTYTRAGFGASCPIINRMVNEQTWWNRLSEVEKLNYARHQSEDLLPEIVYYKGLAFKELGSQYYFDASAYLRQASQMGNNEVRIKAESAIQDICKLVAHETTPKM